MNETQNTTEQQNVNVDPLVSLFCKKYLEKAIANGINKFVTPYILTTMALVLVLWAVGKTGWNKDDTDPPNGRSGLAVKVDYLTGCQYLESPRGLTPRLNPDGDQICREGN